MAAPAFGQVPASAPRTARTLEPKEALRLGREALKAGQLEQALDFAKKAEAANAGARWGLFEDTAEALEKDVASARAKVGKVEAEKLTKAAKDLFAKPTRTAGERIVNLDQAYAMADKASTLVGPSDFFEDIFGGGDRPEKLKKDIDAARAAVRKANPGMVTNAAAKTRPGMPSGVQQAGGKMPAGGTTIPAPSFPTTTVPGATTANKPQATKLMTEGRALLKAEKFAEAKAKAAEAAKLGTFAAGEDSPDLLTRDVLAEGRTKINKMIRDAEGYAASRDNAKATATLTSASQLAGSIGLPTQPIDGLIASLRGMPVPTVPVAVAPVTPAAPIVVAPAMPNVTTLPLTVPVVPAMPTAPVASATPTIAAPTMPVVPVVPAMPALVAPAMPVVPAIPAPVVPGVLTGEQLLKQARASLRSNDLEMARKLAAQAFSTDVASKNDAQALLREIDAEVFTKKRAESVASFRNAAGLFQAKQYDQTVALLKLIDTDALTTEQKAQAELMVKQSEAALMALRPVAPTVAQIPMATPPANGVTTPVAPLTGSTGGTLADQSKALADIEFGKLRSEGLEAEAKARDAFNRGETDLAIQMLNDFINKVKASKFSESRQGLLLGSVERRMEVFRVMKRQTDFYTNEAKTRNDQRSKTAGKQLAESQKQDEIKRKVTEINELSKKKKYREAEELALQVKAMDPDDPALVGIYELCKRQRRVEDADRMKSDKEVATLDLLNGAERVGIVPTDDRPLIVDAQRAMIARMRGNGNELYLKPMTIAEREIEVRLERPLSIDFNNVSLREAINTVRGKSGLNITTDDSAIADDLTSLDKTIVTESLKDLSLRNVLTVLLEKANLKFIVKNDVISITTEKKARGSLVTKVFDVMQLVTPIPDFALAPHQSIAKALAPNSGPAPAWVDNGRGGQTYTNNGLTNGQMVSGQMPGINAPGPVGGQAALLQADNRSSPMASSATLAAGGRSNFSEQLMRTIKQLIRPYSWSDEGGAGKIAYFDIGGALIVNQTADVIREVQELLESLRRLQEVSVSVEIRVMSLSEAFYERIGVDFAANIKTQGTGRFEQSLTTGQFRPEPFINDINVRNVTVGFNPSQGGFTPDLDVPIRPNSFGLGVPPFGGYNGPGVGGLGLGLAFLNDIQVYMFMEASAGDRRASVMQAPKITLFNGQTATVFVSDFAFFTTGLDVINVGGQFVYIPRNVPIPVGNSPAPPGVQVGQGTPGVSVTVQAIVSSDRRFVRMNLAPTLTSLTSATVPLFPVTAFITPVFEGGSQGVPIPFTQFFQQPSISEINVQTTVSCPDGGTVVLGGLKTQSEGRNEFGPPVLSQLPYVNRLFRNQGIGKETRHIMIMVTPRIIIQSEEELNQTGAAPAP